MEIIVILAKKNLPMGYVTHAIEKESEEKKSNPIKFKNAPLSYRSEISNKLSNLEYQYAKENGLLGKVSLKQKSHQSHQKLVFSLGLAVG
ncbi:hypothetical protein DDB_G0269012 [Dictyostelium discoideum AX4]|uniref:Uncharacterized protein n=1 Tax=Dictyostelium discoideum TaxID=44689 RepID=Q55EL9_DICDI|nr:hypothetical protein DDB_G0269012 [Dictyostelium discoideum AX4]EAL73095.1 hypothetical protein DDB_G0269012 [Dictyostelium discoideum AX4]|eukprot:XP_647001.1 hypothetical protein DDB_G0269012 [Dictyostelium discoideum AX4]